MVILSDGHTIAQNSPKDPISHIINSTGAVGVLYEQIGA